MKIEKAKIRKFLNYRIEECEEYGYEGSLESYKEMLSELDNKDKVIDAMAEYISKLDTDEDICMNMHLENCEDLGCKECMIQHFENKVKGDK